MIHSIYIRNVLFYVLAILLPLIISFFLTLYFFQNDEIENMEQNLIDSGEKVLDIANDEHVLKNNLESISYFQLMEFIVMDEQRLVYFDAGYKFDLPDEVISHVLDGEFYRKESGVFIPNILVGLPFEINGENYALFIKPNIEQATSMVRNTLLTALFIVLVIGSLFIMITTKYLVNPITQIILATEELAKSNYQYRVPVTRKDELGKLSNSFNLMATELEKVEQMRKDFIANVSHEFKSPLTSIRGMTIAIKEGLVTQKEATNYLSIIEKETERLSNLTEQLLKLSILESEKYTFSTQNYRLDDQIKNQIVALQVLWEEKNLEIETSLQLISISADKDLLSNLWTNLLSNAIKYNIKGGKLIVKGVEEDSIIKIVIEDTGIGIEDEDLPYIFERFYRADKAHTRTENSYGIGLSMAKKIVEIHHGDIKVSSKVGVGTKIEVFLPKLK
ncbi:sensor histidine kinase [Jeotgalibacillus marinus]|uniref:Heme sensor protein HssS n=1 Tax=Jeotgalibacillus marinus TaxID=86667 RepID=A0ABV3Q734_9BACL